MCRGSLIVVCAGAAGSLILGVFGCQGPPRDTSQMLRHRLRPDTRVVSRVVYYPERPAQALTFQAKRELEANTVGGCDRAIALVCHVLCTREPYSTASAMDSVTRWALRWEKQERMCPLIERAFESEDPFIRWAGIRSAYYLGHDELAARELEKDYPTLLIRPDPVPWWAVPFWRPEARRAARYAPAHYLAGVRENMIRLVGEYGIQDAITVLRAIETDSAEWDEGSKRAARAVAKTLESAGVPDASAMNGGVSRHSNHP